MPKVQMVCRVCGKPYEACRSLDKASGVFRWQEVACSPECGAEYLRLIEESRGISRRKAEPEEMSEQPIENARGQKHNKRNEFVEKVEAVEEEPVEEEVPNEVFFFNTAE